ncbi:hypothetical protein [Streptomyces olivaceus]|uniref:hypothetical protein n=1 Tax=Streptomyces olivaceus TaxID=47716 RepID=UPI00355867B4
MGVDAGGDADVGVAEEFLDDDEVDALFQEQGVGRVAEVVETDLPEFLPRGGGGGSGGSGCRGRAACPSGWVKMSPLCPAQHGSCADITHVRRLGLVRLLDGGPALENLADAGYQGLGARTGGRVVTPPHRTFKKNAPDRYEEMHERQRKAHSSRRIRVASTASAI